MVALTYISSSLIPGRAANALQTMKTAQALIALDPNLQAVVAKGEGDADEASLRLLYGITRVPNIFRLPRRKRLGIHIFNLRAALTARRTGASLVYSRSIGAAAISALIGLPTIFECHAPPSGGERRYWSWLAKSSNFRRLVLISDGLRQIMAENFPEISDMDVVVAHDGVDLEQYSALPTAKTAKREGGRNVDRPVAGYAGHLYAGRGIDIILACANTLPEWDFIIAGGAEEDITVLQNEVAQRNLTNVELLGFVPNAKLPRTLAVADVLLMPYQTSVMVSGGVLDTAHWMSPLKMFEYMAMGRAIVASDLPVLREVLDDNIARLVAPGDEKAWVGALNMLRSDRLRKTLAENARKAAVQYGWISRNDRIVGDLISAC